MAIVFYCVSGERVKITNREQEIEFLKAIKSTEPLAKFRVNATIYFAHVVKKYIVYMRRGPYPKRTA